VSPFSCALAGLAAGLLGSAALAQTPGIGRPATGEEIAGWNIDVAPDGAGLPAGRGTVRKGEKVYARACASCHGPAGRAGPGFSAPPLAGGQGSLATAHPDRTVGSYWPYATTLFDYVRRAMPYDAPESLTADQLYGVCAYILSLDGIVGENAELDAKSLPGIRMPNRTGFRPAYDEERKGVWR